MSTIRKIIYKNVYTRVLLFPFIKIWRLLFRKRHLRQKEVITNMSKLLVVDPIIKIDEFDGIFNVDIKGDLFFRLLVEKKYEPELVKLCLTYIDKDKDIVDIGANVGFFTVLFAKNLNTGKVLSVEPTKMALDRLNKNIKLNKVIDKVIVFEGVVSDDTGIVEIKTIRGKEEYSSLGDMDHPSIVNEEWTTEEVKSIKLDDLIEKESLNPGFIKIDVEGVEHLVFRGSDEVLKKYRPIILSELSDFLLKKNGSSAKEVIDLIRTNDYDVFDPQNPYMKPGIKEFGDIICFPKELKVRL